MHLPDERLQAYVYVVCACQNIFDRYGKEIVKDFEMASRDENSHFYFDWKVQFFFSHKKIDQGKQKIQLLNKLI